MQNQSIRSPMGRKNISWILVKVTAWHTSFGEIKKFNETPSWFTANPIFAKAYHENSQDKGGSVHTYEVKITGNILSQSEARRLANSLGIDFEELTTRLTENPTIAERSELIKEFSDKCDGFFHWDYDPRDWGDGESIFVFNPEKHVRIVKEMNFDDMKESIILRFSDWADVNEMRAAAEKSLRKKVRK